MKNQQNILKNKILNQNQDQNYGDEQFQSINGYYVSIIDKDFQIDFNNASYERIQQSATKMRNMMKRLSKVLDDKIHKYYGLMGVKHKFQQKSQDKLVKQLEKGKYALNKLIISQEKQIKLVEQLDKQMASNKRIQKQAERLRQYFQTKKSMIKAEKQTKFSQGQVNKLGQYLARDLDVEKLYFKLNNIKQNLQYAMLKDQQLIKKQKNLQQKFIQYNQKIQLINSNYEILLMQAKNKKLILSENKEIYQNFMKKKLLFEKKREIKTNMQIIKNSNQSSFHTLATEIQNLRTLKSQKQSKLQKIQSQINLLANRISSKLVSINQQNITKKIQISMSIKNIDTLLKSKRQKSDEIIKLNQSKVFSSSFDLTHSKLLSRPNFKIKQIFAQNRNNSKHILGKSLDLKTINKKENLNQNNQKTLIKWRKNQKKVQYEIPVYNTKNIQIEKHQQENPQIINLSLNRDIQIHIT